MNDEEKLIELLDSISRSTANQVVETSNKKNLKYQPATVVGYDESTYKATVYFGNNPDELFTFYNKSGCKLYEGDNVKIQYTLNPAKGDLVVRCGRTELIASGGGVGEFTNAEKNSEKFNDYTSRSDKYGETHGHIVEGQYHHVEGMYNAVRSDSKNVHVEGHNNNIDSVDGQYNRKNFGTHIEGGANSVLSVDYSHIEGYSNQAKNNTGNSNYGFSHHIEGSNNSISTGNVNHIEGGYNTMESVDSTELVGGNAPMGYSNHIEGGGNTVYQSDYNHIEGQNNIAAGKTSHIEGDWNQSGFVNNTYSETYSCHVEGKSNHCIGNTNHIEGYSCITEGEVNHTEGHSNKSKGRLNHVEGYNCTVNNVANHAEGNNTTAIGGNSHAENYNTLASGNCSHAQGNETEARGNQSFASGYKTLALGATSFAAGSETIAEGVNSTVFGEYNTAKGLASMAIGRNTTASGDGSFVCGLSNFSDESHLLSVGNSAYGKNKPSNTFAVNKYGESFTTLSFRSGSTAYAECFKWHNVDKSEKTAMTGRFVSMMSGNAVRTSKATDEFILGIVVSGAAIGGGSFSKNECIYNYSEKNGGNYFSLNPNYALSSYSPIERRDDYLLVAMLGQVIVKDDGTCITSGYCTSDNNGIATYSSHRTKFYVMSRIDSEHINVLITPNTSVTEITNVVSNIISKEPKTDCGIYQDNRVNSDSEDVFSTDITFSQSFTNKPVVTANLTACFGAIIITNVTTTGFSVKIKLDSGENNCSFNWIAVESRNTSDIGDTHSELSSYTHEFLGNYTHSELEG